MKHPLQTALNHLSIINSKQNALYAWLNTAELTDIYSIREAKERINRVLELEIQNLILVTMKR